MFWLKSDHRGYMNNILIIKSKLDEITALFESGGDHLRFDKATSQEISRKLTELKDFTSELQKSLEKQSKQGKLTDTEETMVKPAVDDIYLTSIAKINRGAKPTREIYNHIADTESTLEYWLGQLESLQSKEM